MELTRTSVGVRPGAGRIGLHKQRDGEGYRNAGDRGRRDPETGQVHEVYLLPHPHAVNERAVQIEEKGVKNGVVLWPLRTAVSGKQNTPGGAFEIMALLGKEETLNRIRSGIEQLQA